MLEFNLTNYTMYSESREEDVRLYAVEITGSTYVYFETESEEETLRQFRDWLRSALDGVQKTYEEVLRSL